jgi:hypothetical protein
MLAQTRLVCLRGRDSRAGFLYVPPFSVRYRNVSDFLCLNGSVGNMSIWELLLLAVGLSMDAFAVSVCKGCPCSASP